MKTFREFINEDETLLKKLQGKKDPDNDGDDDSKKSKDTDKKEDKKEDDFSKYSDEELQTLLDHHKKDLEEYKDSDETAYQAALEDIKAIEAEIKKRK